MNSSGLDQNYNVTLLEEISHNKFQYHKNFGFRHLMEKRYFEISLNLSPEQGIFCLSLFLKRKVYYI